MYPTLYHAVLDLFGVSIPGFKIVMMFGFFVALAFLAASWVITLEAIREGRGFKICPKKNSQTKSYS
jgi:hypothetical protein